MINNKIEENNNGLYELPYAYKDYNYYTDSDYLLNKDMDGNIIGPHLCKLLIDAIDSEEYGDDTRITDIIDIISHEEVVSFLNNIYRYANNLNKDGFYKLANLEGYLGGEDLTDDLIIVQEVANEYCLNENLDTIFRNLIIRRLIKDNKEVDLEIIKNLDLSNFCESYSISQLLDEVYNVINNL